MTWTNSNYSVLPWYDAVSRQQHRKSYAQGQIWPLYTRNKRLPPFQVIKTTALTTAPTVLNLISLETGFSTDILATALSNGLLLESFTGYDVISYTGGEDLDITTPQGQYYAEMSDGTNTWYSEVFFIVHDLSQFVQVNFWHDEPFIIPGGHISYTEPFSNFLYLKTEINRPEYPYEEELSERDGYKFPIYSASKKVFRFTALLPEYMIDVVRLIQQHHFVTIVQFGITYNVDYIRINPTGWVQIGHLNNVEFEFETDTVVQVTGKIKPENEGYSYDQAAYDDSHL